MKTDLPRVLLYLLALVPLGAAAMTLEQAYLDHAQKSDAVPVPIAVVAPQVDPEDVGRSVQVDCWVDATGAVANATIVSGCPDRSFRQAVLAAVRQWKFRPAQPNGHAVAMRARIPVHVAARRNLALFVPDFRKPLPSAN